MDPRVASQDDAATESALLQVLQCLEDEMLSLLEFHEIVPPAEDSMAQIPGDRLLLWRSCLSAAQPCVAALERRATLYLKDVTGGWWVGLSIGLGVGLLFGLLASRIFH
jgi:hypothetical protein